MLQPGIKGHKEQVVTPAMSAARVGSGLVDVFATPMLVALMEQTCYESVLPHLDQGQGTVGTLVSISTPRPHPSDAACGATANSSRWIAADWCST